MADKIRAKMAAAPEDLDRLQRELDENIRYQKHLDARVRFETRKVLLSVANTIALTVAILMCLPSAFALTPILPLLGAILQLSLTVGVFALNKVLEKQKPSSDIKNLDTTVWARQRLFQPAPVSAPKRDEVLELPVEEPYPIAVACAC